MRIWLSSVIIGVSVKFIYSILSKHNKWALEDEGYLEENKNLYDACSKHYDEDTHGRVIYEGKKNVCQKGIDAIKSWRERNFIVRMFTFYPYPTNAEFDNAGYDRWNDMKNSLVED